MTFSDTRQLIEFQNELINLMEKYDIEMIGKLKIKKSGKSWKNMKFVCGDAAIPIADLFNLQLHSNS